MVEHDTGPQIQAGEAMLSILRARRSIRAFQERPIPREVLERVLEGAIWAPSADNRQPWRFVVLQGERKQEFAALLRRTAEGLDPGLSPHRWLYRHGIRNSARFVDGSAATILAFAAFARDSLPIRVVASGDLVPLFTWTLVVQSVAAAVQNLLLEAHACGLGGAWLGYPYLAGPEIKAWLGEEGELQATIILGYPAEERRSTRRPLGEAVRWEGEPGTGDQGLGIGRQGFGARGPGGG